MARFKYVNTLEVPFNTATPNGTPLLFANGDVYETEDALEQEHLQQFVDKKRLEKRRVSTEEPKETKKPEEPKEPKKP